MNIKLQLFRSSLAILMYGVLLFAVLPTSVNAQTTESIPAGSFIIDMGATNPTVANSLKPYGLIYDLLKNYYVPVKRSVNSSKIKDAIDFTYNGKAYKGGPFIISANFRSTAVNKAIYNWRAQGVIVDSTITAVNLPIAFTVTTPPRWAMDAQNGSIAIAYLNEAGIPSTAFSYRTPDALNTCDDIFVMPHADPTWSAHRNLYFWNKNSKGTIWAGCHAPSVIESLYKDTVIGGNNVRLKMNFLTTNGLLMYSSHVHPTPPFVHQYPENVMAQYIGASDSAQIKGSEQVFMPLLGSTWNTDTKVLTYANGQPEIPNSSPGQAAVNIFGRGFGSNANGLVMYQGGHDFSSTRTTASVAQRVAAKKMFFNFSIYALADKLATTLTATVSGIPTQMKALTTYTGLTVSAVGSSGLTYQWIASVPGTFSNPNSNSTSTSFTPAEVTQSTNCMITCLVTDPCGRTIFDSKGGIVLVPSVATLKANAISKSLPSGCTSTTTTFNVFDSNVDSTAGARTLTAVTGFSNGSISFTANGDITYTSNANYHGTDIGTYTISNGSNTASASLSMQVGSLSLYPQAVSDSISVIEDNVTLLSVLANDKNTPSAANGNQLFVRDIVTKPTKGYVYINADGSISYLSKKDASSGVGTDNFTYLVCNAAGLCSVGSVTINLQKDACSAGSYQTGINVSAVTRTDTVYASNDTYIYSNSSSTNYGTATSIQLTSRSSRSRKSLIKFDLSSYSSSQTITSATLFLTASASYSYNASNGPFSVGIVKSKRAWVENQATWANYATSTAWGTAGSANTTSDYTNVDSVTLTNTSNMSAGTRLSTSVTNMVQSWISTPAGNLGMLLIPRVSTTSTTLTASFASKNYTTNTSYCPKLAITYTIPGTTYPCNSIPTTYKPIGYPDAATTASNAAVTFNALTNDANFYGNTNAILSVATTSWKGATISFSGANITYTPSGAFVGIDTFTYVLKDNSTNQTSTVSVRVTVNRVAPVINADAATTPSATPVTINIGANDADPQGALSVPTITATPNNGTVTLNGNNILYTPQAGYTGKDSLVYIRYGSVGSACETPMFDTALVRITIANQAPIANADTVNTTSCAPVDIYLKSNDSDAEGTPLTVYIQSNPTHGTITKGAGGAYRYVSATNYIGTDQFTYIVKDGSSDSLSSNIATVYVTVLPSSGTNTAPVAVIDRDVTYLNQQLILDVKSNDYDAEKNDLTTNITAPGLLSPSNGTLLALANGSITYIPNNNFLGVDSFEYQLCDQNISCSGTSILCATGKVIVRVKPYPIRLSGKVWEDVDNSAHNTFVGINTGAEIGTNTGAGLKVYLLDTLNTVIDFAPVDFTGSYALFNVSPNTKQKLWVSSQEYNLENIIPSASVLIGQLPVSYSLTSPASRTIITGGLDTSGFDFGVNQFPSPTPYTFGLVLNPNSTMVIDSSKVTGTDGGSGFVTQIHYLNFPTNITVFTVNGIAYTSLTWPVGGVTVSKNAALRILPNSGSLTCNITFKVIDNGGAESTDSNIVSIPLYKVLSAGTVSGTGVFCGSGLPNVMTSTLAADGGRDIINYQWQSSTSSTFATAITDISGATTSSYSPSGIISTTTYYRRKAYTAIDSAVYSNILTYTVNALPATPSTVDGSRVGTGTVLLSATAPSGLTIDWYSNSIGGTALATTALTYTTPSISYTTIYYVESRHLTNSCLSPRVPITASVTGTINPGIIGNPQQECGSSIPDSISSIAPASGVTGFAYQWQLSTDSLNWSDIITDTSANSEVYYPEDFVAQTTWYRRAASKSGSTTTYTNTVKITINSLPNAPTVSGNARTGSGTIILNATVGANETADWYDAAVGGSLLLSGSLTYTTPIISATTIYYAVARNVFTGCISATADTANAIINDILDPGLIAGNASVCGTGTPAAFTSVQSGSNGTGAINYVWQFSTTSATSGFSDIGSATALTYAPGLIATTIYYRRKAFTINDAAVYSNVITVTVNPLPNITVSPATTSIITGSSVTLTASGANSYSWSNGDTLASISVGPIALGTYTYTVTGTDGNGCVNTGIASVIVNSLPSVGGNAIAVANTLCAGSSATITLSGHTGTVAWQTSTNGTTWADTTATGSTLVTSPLLVGYRYYRAKVTNAPSVPAYSNGVIVIGTAPSVAGTISGAGSVCVGSNTSTLYLNGTTGNIVKWQSSSVANFSSSITDIVNTTSTQVVNNLSSTTYYRAIVESGVCANDTSAIVQITVNAIPSISSTTDNSRCGTGTVTLGAAASSGTVNWYAASTGGTSLSTGTSYTTPSISTTTTYYVDATSNGCTTASRTAVTATVNAIPSISSTTDNSRCGTGTVTLGAAASAGAINWYAAATGGTSLSTGTSYTTPSISATTTYYVDATASGCTAASRTAVVATVNAIPSISSTTDNSRCGTGTVTLGAAASAGTINWYAASTGGTSLSTGTSFTTPSISATTTYYVDATSNGCTTASRTAVVATVNAIPTISGTTPSSVCGSGTVTLGAAASAGTINWYAASTGGTSLSTGTSYTTPSISTTTTYYVDATASGCTTASRTAVVATVNPIPSISSTTDNSRCGTGTVTLGAAASAGTINWYAASTGGTSLSTGISYTTPSISTTTTYYVDATSNGCTTASRTAVTATVNAIPSISSTTDNSRCGTGTVTLGAAASAGTINWHAASTGGTSLGNGTSFTTPSISTTTTYYVDATSNGCTTATRTAVTATVNPNITASVSVSASSTSVCGAAAITFTATPTNGGTSPTYQWKLNGTNVGIGGTTYTLNSPVVGDSINVIMTSNATPCLVNTTSNGNGIKLNNSTVTPTVSIASSIGTAVCSGSSVTFTATSNNGGSSPSYQWYKNSVVVGTNSATYVTSSLLPGDSIKVILTSNASCVSTTTAQSNALVMTVNNIPTIGTQPTVQRVVSGNQANFSIVATNATAYQWQVSTGGAFANISNGLVYSGVTTTTLTVLNTTGLNNASYRVIATNTCGNRYTDTVQLYINIKPDANNDTLFVVQGKLDSVVALINDVDVDGVLSNPVIIGGPNHGAATVLTSGKVSYQSNANYYGNDTITYRVCDNGNPVACDTAFIIIHINAKPIVVNDTINVNEDDSVIINVRGNDNDPDGPLNNPTIRTNPTNGIITLLPNGTIKYVPNPNYYGLDSFMYKVYDNGMPVVCDSAWVKINVNSVNDGPDAFNDTASVNEDDSVTINVRLNDLDVDGTLNNPVININPTHGTVTVDANGNIKYIPNPNYHGLDSFMYRVCDNGMPVLCDSAWVNINVHDINDGPDAVDDSISINEDDSIIINVRLNDLDVDGTLNNPVININPTHGTVTVDANGNIKYIPNPNYHGLDSFMYRVCDNGMPVLCDSAWVRLYINDVNDAPIAHRDTLFTSEGTPVTADLRTNDIDVDGTLSNPVIIVQPAHGSVTVAANGNITYTPVANYFGKDSLSYRVCDNGMPIKCDSAWVIISIDSINDAPVALDDTASVNEDDSVTINVRLNDLDVDGTLNNPVININPTHGSVVVNTDGTIKYIPNPNYHGLDSFMYRVCDNGMPVLCDSAWVRLNILDINDGPDALDDTASVNEDDSVTINVRLNDSDVDGTLNNPIIRANPTNGIVVVNTDGTIKYIPNPNYHGLDSFMYRVCDNGTPVLCDSAWVRINVLDVNDKPDAINDTASTNQNVAVVINVLTNDTDTDGTLNNPTVITQPLNGTAVVNANGTVTYTPNANYFGVDSFMYRVCDNGTPTMCDSAWVNVTVKNVISNLAPIAVDDTIQVNENDKVVFNVTTNDYDQDGNKLGLPVVIKAPLHGTLLLRADTTFIYIPNTGYIGNDQFTYTIADNGIPSKLDTAVVYIEVVPLVVKVPDGFSPDGDGTNDKFVIPGIEKYPNNKLTIVNRWGDVVYEKSQYQNDWGGEPNKGILLDKGVLPAGNYFYIFETGTTDKSITGSLYINK